jgi:flagellar hook-associated protein 1 FlgK
LQPTQQHGHERLRLAAREHGGGVDEQSTTLPGELLEATPGLLLQVRDEPPEALVRPCVGGSLLLWGRALDEQAEGYVSEVNSLAAQVAALNVRIRAARASGAAPNDLLDARLKIQDRLAELTGATPVPDASGDLGLALPSGLALVSGDAAASISVEPDPATQGLLRFRIVRVDGSGPSVLPNSSFGGALGGVLDARDGALRRTAEGLDTLAFDLGTALNQVHAAGVGLDGSTGQAFFSLPADRHGAAFQIEVDPALLADPSKFAAAGPDDGLPGGASNLFALIATEEQPLSGGRSAIDAFASLVSSFGAETTRARAAADQTGALRSNLESLRESASGVSVDEEVIEMTKAQRAYEAISKVITTADEMLEKLLELR